MTRALLVVILLSLFNNPAVTIPLSPNNPSSVPPSASLPINERTLTLAPSEARFKATFPAPPIRYSVRSNATTGTGASGDIRSTCPHKYVSSITSPITPALSRSNCPNNCLKSVIKSDLPLRRPRPLRNGHIIQRYTNQHNDQTPGRIPRLLD